MQTGASPVLETTERSDHMAQQPRQLTTTGAVCNAIEALHGFVSAMTEAERTSARPRWIGTEERERR